MTGQNRGAEELQIGGCTNTNWKMEVRLVAISQHSLVRHSHHKSLASPQQLRDNSFQFIQASRFPSTPTTLGSKSLLRHGSSNESKLHSGMDLRLTLRDGCGQSHVRPRSRKTSRAGSV